MHLEILKKGFLPPVNLHSQGVDETIKPAFPKEAAATLPVEMVSAKGILEKSDIYICFFFIQEAKYFEGK